MDVQAQIRRLGWRSKRGLLELELILLPFAESCLVRLTTLELTQYAALLEHDDLDLYDWLRGLGSDSDKRDKSLQPIVDCIRQYHNHL